MNRRTTLTALLATAIFVTAGVVAFIRFSPPGIPSNVTLRNDHNEVITYVWSGGVQSEQRGTIAPTAQATAQFQPGARLDLFLPQMSVPAASWLIRACDGNIVIASDPPGIRLEGIGLEVDAVVE
jgi:hypothetical protein